MPPVDGEERGRGEVAGRRNSWWRERGFGVRMEEEASGKEKKNKAGLASEAQNSVISFKRNDVIPVKANDRAFASHGRHAV